MVVEGSVEPRSAGRFGSSFSVIPTGKSARLVIAQSHPIVESVRGYDNCGIRDEFDLGFERGIDDVTHPCIRDGRPQAC